MSSKAKSLVVLVVVVSLGLAACASLRPAPKLSIGNTQVRETDDMLMVYVPGGTFQMGTEASDPAVEVYETPQHSVTLDSFWIDQNEVTNAQYAGCVTDGACSPPYQSSSATRESYFGDSQYDNYPVIRVTWNDATTYCAWAGGGCPAKRSGSTQPAGPKVVSTRGGTTRPMTPC
jgi:formylglycine-generating enzyme required for sulfatase activity